MSGFLSVLIEQDCITKGESMGKTWRGDERNRNKKAKKRFGNERNKAW